MKNTNFTFENLLIEKNAFFLILEYSKHEQIGKWIQINKKILEFVKIHVPEFFQLENNKGLIWNWYQICSQGNVNVAKYMISKRIDNGQFFIGVSCFLLQKGIWKWSNF